MNPYAPRRSVKAIGRLSGCWWWNFGSFISTFWAIVKHGLAPIPEVRSPEFLSSGLCTQVQEEREHPELWALTAASVGVSWEELNDTPKNLGVVEINRYLSKRRTPQDTFIVFFCVEQLANSISQDFLSSQAFLDAVKEDGALWFETHLSGVHNELCLRCAWHYGELNETKVRAEMDAVYGRFLSTADAFINGSPNSECGERELGDPDTIDYEDMASAKRVKRVWNIGWLFR